MFWTEETYVLMVNNEIMWGEVYCLHKQWKRKIDFLRKQNSFMILLLNVCMKLSFLYACIAYLHLITKLYVYASKLPIKWDKLIILFQTKYVDEVSIIFYLCSSFYKFIVQLVQCCCAYLFGEKIFRKMSINVLKKFLGIKSTCYCNSLGHNVAKNANILSKFHVKESFKRRVQLFFYHPQKC